MGTRADYAATVAPGGGVIEHVEADSPAGRAGIVAGERIRAVDGHPISDIIDWQWYSDGLEITVVVSTADTEREVEVVRGSGEIWGLTFTDALFDRVRTCRNDCAFCFMTQLPKGLRTPLYLRDDDYRLSFLQGNFVTLTNLVDSDVERIIEQHLSPLYVSLHSVDPDIRARLVCARDEDRTLERIDQLLAAGIDLHIQIVLVPGVNDGAHLDASLAWLAEREGIESVGIVPVGYTAHQDSITASYTGQIEAAVVIEQVQRWQFAMRERDEITWVHLADEFYLNARAPIPRTEWYDGYPQYENGIGLVRAFVDETLELRPAIEAALLALPADQEHVTIVTGIMAATTLAGALDACEAMGRVRLLVVPNRFFGGNVSVTGLLTGRDIADAIAADGHGGVYVVPDVVLNADGLTLDDFEVSDIARVADEEILMTTADARGLLDALQTVGNDML